jgi:hypothetical protein
VATVWVWAVIVAIAAGLPIAAWLLSRNLKPPRQGGGGPPGFGHIDRWLLEHYQLGALDRLQVEEAIFRDVRKLREPRLQAAARGVAAELLSGRLRLPWQMRWGGWWLMGIGLTITTLDLIARFITHSLGDLSVLYVAEGVPVMALGASLTLWAPKQMRRNLMRLTEDHADDRSSTS